MILCVSCTTYSFITTWQYCGNSFKIAIKLSQIIKTLATNQKNPKPTQFKARGTDFTSGRRSYARKLAK